MIRACLKIFAVTLPMVGFLAFTWAPTGGLAIEDKAVTQRTSADFLMKKVDAPIYSLKSQKADLPVAPATKGNPSPSIDHEMIDLDPNIFLPLAAPSPKTGPEKTEVSADVDY